MSPTEPTVAGEADLVRASVPRQVAATEALAGAEVTGAPLGGTPLAVAVSLIEPLSRSSWVTSYVAVHVVPAPGRQGRDRARGRGIESAGRGGLSVGHGNAREGDVAVFVTR